MPRPVETAFRECPIGGVATEHQCSHACDVGMKRDPDHAKHQPDMFIERGWDTERHFRIGSFHGGLLSLLQPSFDLPNIIEVGFEADAVAGSEFVAKRSDVANDLIQNGTVDLDTSGSFFRSTASAEQALEDFAGIDLMRKRLSW